MCPPNSVSVEINHHSELAPLVHHIELSKSSFRSDSLKCVILSILFKQEGHIHIDQCYQAVKNEIGESFSQQEIHVVVDSLISEDQVVLNGSQSIKLSEETRTDIASQIAAQKKREKSVIAYFNQLSEDHRTSDLFSWQEFYAKFLLPLIKEMGAKTFQLIASPNTSLDASFTFNNLLNSMQEEDHTRACSLISSFFDPTKVEARDYVLSLLQASYASQAVRLPRNTTNKLLSRMKQTIAMNVFVDTNFVFSILDLHDNPANEAAKALFDLISELRGKVNVNLNLLPITIDEAVRTLDGYSSRLSEIHPTPRFSNLVANRAPELSGIAKKFFQRTSKGKSRIDAKDYFSPYINDFKSIAISKGLNCPNIDTSKLSINQDVIDDIQTTSEHEQATRPERAKNYEAIAHDVIMWHHVKKLRPIRIDSPLDAGAWIVTVDFRFIAFDQMKLKRSRNSVPICIHPSTLVQFLQFWSPLDETHELNLFKSVRSMLPSQFSISAEKATTKILSALSRYENIDDIPEEVKIKTLINQALREKVFSIDEPKEVFEIVNEEVVQLVNAYKELADAKSAEINESNKLNRYLFSIVSVLCLAFIFVIHPIIFEAPVPKPFQWLIYVLQTLAWLELSLFIGSKLRQIKSWELLEKIKRFRKWLWGSPIIPLAVGLMQTFMTHSNP